MRRLLITVQSEHIYDNGYKIYFIMSRIHFLFIFLFRYAINFSIYPD